VNVSPNSFHHQYLLISVLWWIRAWHIQQSPFAVIRPTNLTFSRYITVFFHSGLQIWLMLWHIPFRERQRKLVKGTFDQCGMLACSGGISCNSCKMSPEECQNNLLLEQWKFCDFFETYILKQFN
jgi:hypothetical protein